MLTARQAQRSCPQCRSLISNLFESTSRQVVPRARLSSTSRQTKATSLRTVHSSAIRQFSTTRRALEETKTDTNKNIQDEPANAGAPPTAEELEKTVRDARQTFGNTLPEGFLTKAEYKMYERLYGPPLRATRPEDVGINLSGAAGMEGGGPEQHTLLRETGTGFEEVKYTIAPKPASMGTESSSTDETTADGSAGLNDAEVEYLEATANSQREYDALVLLQRDFQAAMKKAAQDRPEYEEDVEEEPEEDDLEEDEDEDDPDAAFWNDPENSRSHPLTDLGKFSTTPSTLYLSKDGFVQPITNLLGRSDMKHVQLAAETAFGGHGLPHSPSTPNLKKPTPQKPIGLEASHHRMSEIQADAFIAAALPPIYSSVMSVLVETRKRLGSSWLRGLFDKGGPRILELGAGGGGLVACQEILTAEWQALLEAGKVQEWEAPMKKTMVVGSDALRQRVSTFLNNTTFLPRLPDYLHTSKEGSLDNHTPVERKKYDIIIATHALMPHVKTHKRKQLLDNLWSMLSPEGGVLIMLEKGHPRGFEAIADVRQRVLDRYINPPNVKPPLPEIPEDGEEAVIREPGMIIAPCTNHSQCPMYLTAGESPGRKDFCHFKQRFIRPPFLQKILGASHRNHEDVRFSYIALRRGAYDDQPLVSPETLNAPSSIVQGSKATDRAFAGFEDQDASSTPHPLTLPRLVLTPLKRRGHVTMDVCTPAASIERWVVPRSFSKQGYRDARKSQWGDLWALGAKTRTPRNVRLGRGSIAADASASKDSRDGSARAERKVKSGRRRANVVEGDGLDAAENVSGGKAPRQRRAGKGGRKLISFEEAVDELGLFGEDGEGGRDEVAAEMRETRRVMRKERGQDRL